MDTMLIQLTNQKARGLLHELEELRLIKVLKQNIISQFQPHSHQLYILPVISIPS